jgi:uncharacterized protein (DUF433 family)
MSSATHYPHVEMNSQGQAQISATRYKVLHLAAEHYHYGWSAEELLRQHADLRPEEIYGALTYFYDHYEPMVAELRSIASKFQGDSSRSENLSREELIRRSNTQSWHRGA